MDQSKIQKAADKIRQMEKKYEIAERTEYARLVNESIYSGTYIDENSEARSYACYTVGIEYTLLPREAIVAKVARDFQMCEEEIKKARELL